MVVDCVPGPPGPPFTKIKVRSKNVLVQNVRVNPSEHVHFSRRRGWVDRPHSRSLSRSPW